MLTHKHTHTQDVVVLAKQQASVILEIILSAHAHRTALLPSYETAITNLKTTEDAKSFKKSKKELDVQYVKDTEKIAAQARELQTTDPEIGSKVYCVPIHVLLELILAGMAMTLVMLLLHHSLFRSLIFPKKGLGTYVYMYVHFPKNCFISVAV